MRIMWHITIYKSHLIDWDWVVGTVSSVRSVTAASPLSEPASQPASSHPVFNRIKPNGVIQSHLNVYRFAYNLSILFARASIYIAMLIVWRVRQWYKRSNRVIISTTSTATNTKLHTIRFRLSLSVFDSSVLFCFNLIACTASSDCLLVSRHTQ